MTCTSPVDLSRPRRPCWRLDRARLRHLCSHLAVAPRGPPTPPNAFARGIQRPTPNTQQVVRATQHPRSVGDTQRPISNTQRPKIFLPLRGIFLYGGCWDPAGCLGGRRRLVALVPSPLGAAAVRWGAAARSREVYQPGRRETGGGRATQRPFKRRTPGATLPRTQHPTSNTQRPPNTQHPTLGDCKPYRAPMATTTVPL